MAELNLKSSSGFSDWGHGLNLFELQAFRGRKSGRRPTNFWTFGNVID
jgi:hypothetical protein